MYNLKEVYATISFDYDKIRLLVVEQKDNGQINCLYYNHLQISYLNEDLSFSSTSKLLDTVGSLIRQADKFLSNNIKRYILNISCMSLKSANLRSSESLIFGPLTLATATNCVNRVLDSGKNVNEMLLQVVPSKWYVDGKKYNEFPEGTSGKRISFDYVGLTCSSKIVNQFVDLLNTLNIKVLATTCNSLCLNSVNTLNRSNAVIVDVKYTRTIINIYDENGFIKSVYEISIGFIAYMANLKRILGIPQNMDIMDIVKKIHSMNKIDANIPLINFHGNVFLEVQEATANDILKAIHHANKIMLESIYNKIVAIRAEFPDLPKLVKVNAVEEFVEVSSYIDNCVVNNDITFSVLKNNVLGLEDSGVNDMIACGKYVYEEQLSKQMANTYSIDPYVSQQKVNENINKSILLKIGILSTQWAAKIGE